MKHTIHTFEKYCTQCKYRVPVDRNAGVMRCWLVDEYKDSHIGNLWPNGSTYLCSDFEIPKDCPFTLEIAVDRA